MQRAANPRPAAVLAPVDPRAFDDHYAGHRGGGARGDHA
jgi:hypothetical protein